MRCLQKLPVIKEFTTPKGEKVYDFGQNLTGWVEVEIYGEHGQKLTLRHAESLDENGNFYTENLSWAKATDTYILSGGKQTLHPHFTWHGFRYICVEGLQYGQNVQFTACHLSTDLAQTGHFTCSDKRVNRLQQNIQWSQRDNFLDIPTDCPQRSERLGWTGDVTAFCPTAAFNENIMPFMTKWLRDLASELGSDVSMPQVVPNILGNQQDGAAFWGDVVTVLPWTLYRAYGDKRILQHSYDSMKHWVEFIESQCGENGLWQTGFQYGDWLGLDAEANALGDERKGATDDYFTANVCFAWSLQILADTAAVLQYTEDARRWSRRREELVRAFRAEYVTPTGRLVSETQTALILALHFDMVPDEFRPRLLDALEKNIGAHKTHLLTGFIGTPFACLTLSENGRHDLAGRLLLQEDDPSWLYEVKMGATTIWERWNSIRPDGSFNPANMNSLNHYAYGSIGNWLYTKLCGLEILEPGYKKFALRPQFIKGITHAELTYESVYGKIAIAWRCEGGKITVDATVPANTTAELTLPEQTETLTLGSGSYHYEYATETSLEIDRYSLETPLHIILEHPAAQAIFRQYAPEFLENPYRLADDIEGVGFRTADEIAARIGIHTDSDYRIRSGLFYILQQAVAEGHIYLPEELLLRRAKVLLGIEIEDIEYSTNSIINVSASFGAKVQYIQTNDLQYVTIDSKFSGLKLYFDQATIQNQATIEIDGNFTGIQLYVPKEWNVQSHVRAFFGGVDEKGQPSSSGYPTLNITGCVHFGGVEIHYI